MATGPLRFRTPHIEELPTTQSKHAPGFSWVAVTGPVADPAKNWGTDNRKRATRGAAGGQQTELQREALSARQQRDIERKLRELNNDGNTKDVEIPIPAAKKGAGGGGGAVRPGKTTGTKKILASGKTFAHHLEDEEARIALTGRREDAAPAPAAAQRASKTPLARRKARESSSVSSSPAPSTAMGPPPLPHATSTISVPDRMDIDQQDGSDEDDSDIPPLPSAAEIEALLNLPPLTYNEARSRPPPPGAAPPRRFCETCGYWGRVRCLKCGTHVCSVVCKDDHDQFKCLKMYA